MIPVTLPLAVMIATALPRPARNAVIARSPIELPVTAMFVTAMFVTAMFVEK
jgi:hypothetical protein